MINGALECGNIPLLRKLPSMFYDITDHGLMVGDQFLYYPRFLRDVYDVRRLDSLQMIDIYHSDPTDIAFTVAVYGDYQQLDWVLNSAINIDYNQLTCRLNMRGCQHTVRWLTRMNYIT